MRTLLLASLASLAVTAALHDPADACGRYDRPPAVFQLSDHSILEGRQWSTRTFALLRADPVGTPAWHQIAPGTYDHTQIAFAPSLETPTELTLVGPAGTRLISSRSRVFLKPARGATTATAAVEVTAERGDFVIALAGRHTDIKWIAVEGERNGTAADVAWIKQVSSLEFDPSYVYVSKVKGTELETITVPRSNGQMMSFIRRSDQRYVMRFDGSIAGAMMFRGRQFVLVSTADGGARAIRIRA